MVADVFRLTAEESSAIWAKAASGGSHYSGREFEHLRSAQFDVGVEVRVFIEEAFRPTRPPEPGARLCCSRQSLDRSHAVRG